MAVGAAAGFVVNAHPPDYNSVDLGISAPDLDGLYKDPHLHIQAKCTSTQPTNTRWLTYDLRIKNYEDLRANNQIPMILVVMVVPLLRSEWLIHSPESLTLLRCAYWKSLKDFGPTNNTTTIRISLDRGNVFDIPSLQRIMNSIAEGQSLQ